MFNIIFMTFSPISVTQGTSHGGGNPHQDVSY